MSTNKMRVALEAALLREDLGPELSQQMREALDSENRPVSAADIRSVFLAHGFTIKPGCDDLKPYVYAAGRALVKLAQSAPLPPQAEAVTVDVLAELMANAECTPDETAWRYMGEMERNSWRAAARVAMANRLDGGQPKAEAVAQHPDDAAVDRFAAAMKAKLAASRAKGRSGWDNQEQCTVAHLARLLVVHIPKGDPVDVANFAMMLHQRGAGRDVLANAAKTAPPASAEESSVAQPAPQERRPLTPEQLKYALTGHTEGYITGTVWAIALDVQTACAEAWGVKLANATGSGEAA